MAKYIAMVVGVLVLSVAAYFGLAWYRTATNTPERGIAAFTTDITDPQKPTYDRLTPELKKHYSPSQWKDFIATFKSAPAPIQVAREQVEDTLNTYPDNSQPQRFTYKYQIQGRNYQAVIILLKQEGKWLVDDIQGSYQ